MDDNNCVKTHEPFIPPTPAAMFYSKQTLNKVCWLNADPYKIIASIIA